MVSIDRKFYLSREIYIKLSCFSAPRDIDTHKSTVDWIVVVVIVTRLTIKGRGGNPSVILEM